MVSQKSLVLITRVHLLNFGHNITTKHSFSTVVHKRCNLGLGNTSKDVPIGFSKMSNCVFPNLRWQILVVVLVSGTVFNKLFHFGSDINNSIFNSNDSQITDCGEHTHQHDALLQLLFLFHHHSASL